MIVLDTNVVSEFMRPAPDPAVRAWLLAQHTDRIAITTLTLAEIHAGIARLSDGHRKSALADHLQRVMTLGPTLLPFDEAAAQAYGAIAAARERAGRGRDAIDLMIAAIACVNGATVATRNIKDFEMCGVALVNPFDAG